MDCLVVGAGFAGATVAERLASEGRKVVVLDRRSHIGGNAFDEYDRHGLLIHRYGPHIFHTNSKRIFEYLSRFTHWRFYEHRVRSVCDGVEYPFPINRDTVNRLYELDLDDQGVADYFEAVREPVKEIKTSEDVVVAAVGRDLYERFYLNYTRKQWGLEPGALAAGVAARIPVRTTNDDRYFSDDYQFMPAQGYHRLFERMLESPRIEVRLLCDFERVRSDFEGCPTVYTGPIDAYFGHCYGKLPYRSLRFEHEHLPDVRKYQSVGTVNFPNDHEYTRVTEFKQLTGQEHTGTSIVREFPQSDGDPYYPIPRPGNEMLFKRYSAMASALRNVYFVGRLAQYRYYNMDQVVGAAIKTAESFLADRN